MKKIISIIIIGILVVSGLGAVAVSDSDNKLVKEDFILLSTPAIEEKGKYLSVNLEESTSLLLDSGKPVLPVVTKVYTFPLGAKIDDVVVTFNDVEKHILSKKIIPSSEPVPLLANEKVSAKLSEIALDEKIYSSNELYPEEQYIVRNGVGLKDGEHVMYLTVRCNPIQYSPAVNTMFVAGSIEIDINYDLPVIPVIFADEYDLLIITPEEFKTGLDPLVAHKTSLDPPVRTVVETTENIYANSDLDGRDEPEDIKLYIQYAIEEWGIDYVLLFGGRKGQTFDWYIPERLSLNDDNSNYEVSYSSDLYYSDVYKLDEENNTVFEDWDSNGNGIFAEFRGMTKDIMDFYPDVYVGRIPCRYSFQIGGIIDKIITYETSADDSWFKKAVVISGDTSPPARGPVTPGVYEGELSTGVTADLLEDIGFTVDKLWTSLETFTGPQDVIDGLNSGVGLVHFAGHGNPAYWGNFLPDAETEEGMVDGLGLKHMRQLKNSDELPIVVVGGCHNAQFNTTMMNIISGIKEYGFLSYFGLWPNATKNSYRFYYKEWVPACWASWLLLKKGGGSIATIGNSGLGWGYINEHVTSGLGGWLNPRFFDCYANQSIDVLGEAHSQAITDYINIVQGVNSVTHDRKTIEGWVLLGDPSLKIGGYAE